MITTVAKFLTCGLLLSLVEAGAVTLPGRLGEVPLLGTGFDPVRSELRPIRCFSGGTIEETQGGQGQLEVKRNLSKQALQKRFSGKIGLSIPIFPGINATGSAGFAAEFAADRHSDTLTLSFESQHQQKRLYFKDLAQDLHWVPNIQTLTTWPQPSRRRNFHVACGDHFVSGVAYGMALTAHLKVSYARDYDRKQFRGAIGVDVLAGIAKGEVELGYEQIAQQTQIEVSLSVQQRGGPAFAMLAPLKAVPDGSMFLQCDQSTFKHCATVFAQLIKASHGLTETTPDNPVALFYETTAYPMVGPIKDMIEQNPNRYELIKAWQQLRQRRWLLESALQEMRLLRKKLHRQFGLPEEDPSLTKKSEALQAGQIPCTETFALESCEKAVALAEGIPLTNPWRQLQPKTWTEWCLLSGVQGALSEEDRATVRAVMNQWSPLGVEVSAPSEDHCREADYELSQWKTLSLKASPYPIRSVRPLACLPNLEKIDLSNQWVSDIQPLQTLVKLRSLNLTGNAINNFDGFQNFLARPLEEINLSRNKIRGRLNWPGEPIAARLRLRQNSILGFDDWDFSGLTHLDLSRNPLSEDHGLIDLAEDTHITLFRSGIACQDLGHSNCSEEKP